MKKIAAGIVTYNPDLNRLHENINAILPQVELVFLVDNGSKNIDELENAFIEKKVVLIKNKENLGIAAALNKIMEYSIDYGYEWTLTLDQDSVVPDNMIEEYEKYTEEEMIAMIVPVIFDRTMSIIDVNGKLTQNFEYVENAITSGTLMNNQIWKEVKGFEEKLFIDYVDFDYCMKVRLANYRILRVNTVKLLHELGNASEIKVFHYLGKLFHRYPSLAKKFMDMRYTTNHSPIRVYYVTRNQYYYMNKYKEYIDVKRLKRGMKIAWIVKLIFEKQRIKKWKAIRQGIKDGKNMH